MVLALTQGDLSPCKTNKINTCLAKANKISLFKDPLLKRSGNSICCFLKPVIKRSENSIFVFY